MTLSKRARHRYKLKLETALAYPGSVTCELCQVINHGEQIDPRYTTIIDNWSGDRCPRCLGRMIEVRFALERLKGPS